MFDLAFIEQCAAPGVEIAIVERFIAQAGTANPLAVSITAGNRVILPEAPRTPEQAMRLVERFVGDAVVRVGVTRYPAGHGTTDPSELDIGLVDACENIRMGSALFDKVYRIVAHADGSTDGRAFAVALEAWDTGLFDGRYVFGEPDPGPINPPMHDDGATQDSAAISEEVFGDAPVAASDSSFGEGDPNKAGIRVDLSGISSAQER